MKSPAENNPFSSRIKPRHLLQLIVFILTVAIGIQFAVFVIQSAGDGAVTVLRPPGVEGFLPIGALMGWKLFLTTGMWDPVHPAAMVILGFAVILSFFFRKAFCAWFCPVGTLSEWMWKAGKKIIGRNLVPPRWLDILLQGIKYALLGFFIYIIFSMSKMAIIGFLHSAYYKLSDVKMLHFFTRMSMTTLWVLLVIVVLSFLVKNFWCRYLCPYGAFVGLFAMVSPCAINRNVDTCIDCGQCAKLCPSRLPVDQKKRIVSPECTGCMDCVDGCPVDDALCLSTKGMNQKKWAPGQVALVIAGVFFLMVFSARITGHWESRVPEPEYRMLLKNIDSPEVRHPGMNRP